MNLIAFTLCLLAATPLGPGDHTRTLQVDGRIRTYIVHVPSKYDPKQPTPVVLIFHGGGSNAQQTVRFTGLNEKADKEGFIAIYPNGTGYLQMLTWNGGNCCGYAMKNKVDDVAFTRSLLDDLATVANLDARRVFATGISNGGIMCYWLASELSDRIASIAPVAGTMGTKTCNPKRPVPVMHFHGTDDTFLPFTGGKGNGISGTDFFSVDYSVQAWVKANGCPEKPVITDEPTKVEDGTTVRRKTYGPGKDGAEVILFTISGGGHTWPGRDPRVQFLGKSTKNISANDLMWEFFKRHPMPTAEKSSKQPETTTKIAGPITFDIKAQKDEDHVKATVEKDMAIFDATSRSGIGGATITLKNGNWPTTVVLRFHLRGLELFSISNGKVKLSGSVLSHSENPRLLHVDEDGKEKKVEQGNPYWTEIRVLDASGRLVDGLPGKGGYFEITLPKALLDGDPKSLELVWIDFYRK